MSNVIQPVLSAEQYAIERAICDKAFAYWKANATYSRGGWSSLSAEKAKHPDYAACDNDMRGRVEQYELLRDLPEKLSAYIGSREPNGMGIDKEVGRTYPVTVWTGLAIGFCTLVSHYSRRKRFQCYATISGRDYTGSTEGVGMFVNLRETAASKRKRADAELTRVIFRKDDGEIVACFPDDMSCYSHIGQHSEYVREWYADTKPATPEEYADLKRELESAPYDYRFKVITRHP